MIAFSGGLILLDIEGTVSPLAFVHEVLFPYARMQVGLFLAERAGEEPVAQALAQMASDSGHASIEAWLGAPATTEQGRARVVAEVKKLMDADAKATGLKQLQGLIWEDGFRDGTLRATIFPDVPPALTAWTSADRDIRIYSSGSIAAQRLFFEFTQAGDLRGFLSGFYDTMTGGKREAESYTAIAHDSGYPPGEILFLSDVPEELDAARASGCRTGLVMRPGNKPVVDGGHPTITSFEQIVFS